MIAAATLRVVMARAGLAFLLVALFLAAPGLMGAPALRGIDELGLMRVTVRALSGLTLPLAGAALAVVLLGANSRLRRGADRLVGAGLLPGRAGRALVLTVVVVAVGVGAPLGGAASLILRGAARLGDASMALRDAGGTAWAVALGSAAWASVAAALVMRSGLPTRALVVIAIDLPTRLLPGASVWLSPTAHVDNLLGAPPPLGLVPVPVLPQLVSALVLTLIAVFAAWLAVLRYDGIGARG